MLTFTFACLPNYHNNGLKISLLVDVCYRDFALRNTENKDGTYSNLVTGIAGVICEQTLAVRSLFCSLFKVVKCCTCKHVLPGTLAQSMRTGFGGEHVLEEYGVEPQLLLHDRPESHYFRYTEYGLGSKSRTFSFSTQCRCSYKVHAVPFDKFQLTPIASMRFRTERSYCFGLSCSSSEQPVGRITATYQTGVGNSSFSVSILLYPSGT